MKNFTNFLKIIAIVTIIMVGLTTYAIAEESSLSARQGGTIVVIHTGSPNDVYQVPVPTTLNAQRVGAIHMLRGAGAKATFQVRSNGSHTILYRRQPPGEKPVRLTLEDFQRKTVSVSNGETVTVNIP